MAVAEWCCDIGWAELDGRREGGLRRDLEGEDKSSVGAGMKPSMLPSGALSQTHWHWQRDDR